MTQNSNTLNLVRTIGVPGAISPRPGEADVKDCFEIAEKNKIPLLFLKSLSDRKRGDFQEEIERHERWHRNAQDLSIFASSTLAEAEIDYTFFKTLKPFPYAPSDIDVLLRDESDLDCTIDLFRGLGFESLERSSYGCTLYSSKHDLNLDLTTRIDVSGLVYLDKKHVFEETNEKRIRGTKIRTPKACADMTIVAAHALYKEQLFTLSDYYTLAIWKEHLEESLKFAEKGKIKPAFLWTLNLASDITKSAFGNDNEILETIDKLLRDEDENKQWKVDEDAFEMPYNCPLPLLIKALMKKMSQDAKARKSTSNFLRNFADPRTISEMIKHFERESY